MEMMTITNQRNRFTLTMPQNLFWTSYGCYMDGQARIDAREIDEALHDDDRDRARELLDKYNCVVEFFTDYDYDPDSVAAQPLYVIYKETSK